MRTELLESKALTKMKCIWGSDLESYALAIQEETVMREDSKMHIIGKNRENSGS